jgi:hypothetical protein
MSATWPSHVDRRRWGLTRLAVVEGRRSPATRVGGGLGSAMATSCAAGRGGGLPFGNVTRQLVELLGDSALRLHPWGPVCRVAVMAVISAWPWC